ncbi:MAG: S8 family peptidase [bacterium]|nr:S8 family peptidase [bacterium]
MADDRPLLNPVLRLKMDGRPEPQTGGGKGRASVVVERLAEQQRVLSAAARNLYRDRERLPTYGGRTHLLVRMFAEDSLAPSHTPDDLFSNVTGCQLVAPYRHGYVVEAEIAVLPRLTAAIENPVSFAVQSDISRVSTVAAFSTADRLRHHSAEQLWNAAPADDDGRLFVVWLAPFHNREAQEDVLREVEALSNRVILPTFTVIQLASRGAPAPPAGPLTAQRQSSIARAMRMYRNTGVGRAAVRVPTLEALNQLIASGVSHRIDPVRPIRVAAPGEGTEPPPPAAPADAPIVGVVDGGLHATSYSASEAWRAPPLVSNAQADRRHGNAITSLVVQGHAWNTNRLLPALTCRIGTVQAVPHATANRRFDERELIDYLAAVVRAHPETHVWNISANQEGPQFDPDEISVLGHEITELARAANILPVVSVGNVRNGTRARLNPPGDSEAAITVGGRQADARGRPAGACPRCLGGPGPDGMLKPDVAWFSELRMIGGAVGAASSYPTALVSSLAAHTFANLREPTPDLVKALMINAGERNEHDAELGWGTPFHGTLPWSCEPGSVTLAWRAKLQPGANYYWSGIPIPPELIRNGKLYGRASLTAILRPLVSPFAGANYFASRLQTSLRYPTGADDWEPLVGKMLESTLREQDARDELKKWQPVRRHTRDFTHRDGIAFNGTHLQLYARVFTRDLYQFGWNHHSQAGEQDVAFVLTLWSGDGAPSIYNSTVNALGNFVESAVVNQDIEVGNG